MSTFSRTVYDPKALGLHIVRQTGSELLCQCPYHPDSNPSATYSPEKGIFHCFTCKTSKTSTQLAKDLGGSLVKVALAEAHRELSGDDSEWVKLLHNPAVKFGSRGFEYLTHRGVTKTQIAKRGFLENKDGVILPLANKFGGLYGCIMRHFTKKPKYMFYGSRPPIWPYPNLGKSNDLFIVEGIFGVLRLEVLGYNAIASMGTGHTAQIAQITKSSATNPVSFFDPDYAGRLAAGKLLLMSGIPAIINYEHADEIITRKTIDNYKVTYNVMDIIESAPQPQKLQSALEKFWRKLP